MYIFGLLQISELRLRGKPAVPTVNRQPRTGFYKTRRSLFTPSLLNGPISDAITEASEESCSIATFKTNVTCETGSSESTSSNSTTAESLRLNDIETNLDEAMSSKTRKSNFGHEKSSLQSNHSKKSAMLKNELAE